MSELAVEYILDELKELKAENKRQDEAIMSMNAYIKALKEDIAHSDNQLIRMANMLEVKAHKGSVSDDKYIDFKARIWQSYDPDDYAFIEHIIEEYSDGSARD